MKKFTPTHKTSLKEQKILGLLGLILTAAAAVLSWAIVKERLPLGNDQWHWYYHTNEEPYWQTLVLAIIILTLVFGWTWAYLKTRQPVWRWVMLLIGAAAIMILLTFSIYRIKWMNYVVNEFGTVGYLTFAKKFDSIPELLARYNQEIARPENFRTHPSTHPFGTTALYWLLWKVDNVFFPNWGNDPLVGYLMAGIGWLGIIPLYLISRRFLPILLLVLSPVIYFFAPFPELAIMTLALWAFWLVWRYKKWWVEILAGVLFGAGILISGTMLPLLGGTLIWLFFCKKELSWTGRILRILLILFTIVILYLLLFWFGHYSFIENLRIAQPAHTALIYGERSYSQWIWWNLYDYGLFLGLPALALIIWGLLRFFSSPRQGLQNQNLTIAAIFFIMLILTNFSGTVRAETSRLYLSFTPFLLLAVNFKKSWPKWFIAGLIVILVFSFLSYRTKIHTVPRHVFPDEIKIFGL